VAEATQAVRVGQTWCHIGSGFQIVIPGATTTHVGYQVVTALGGLGVVEKHVLLQWCELIQDVEQGSEAATGNIESAAEVDEGTTPMWEPAADA